MRILRAISRRWLCWAVIALAITCNVVALVLPKGFAHRLWTNQLSSSNPVLLASQAIDDLLAQHAPATNIFLRVEGYGREDDLALGLAYFRSVYTLYPRRVFVGGSNDVINHGRDLLTNRFGPKASWLDQHQVSTIVTLSRDAEGSPRFEVNKREEQQ